MHKGRNPQLTTDIGSSSGKHMDINTGARQSMEAALPLIYGLLPSNTDLLTCDEVCRMFKQTAASLLLPQPVVLKAAMFRCVVATSNPVTFINYLIASQHTRS
jgi:hypothetical protein